MKKIIFIVLGIAAGVILICAGIQMLDIKSQASQIGNITITEVYYHAMGLGFIGLGILGGGLLIGFACKD